MKYIIIGLGNLGVALSERLTSLGHEVIGVDIAEHKIEEYKNTISNTIRLDATELNALKILPLKDTDAVIVAIGENFGASILIIAQLKQLGVKRIIARSISKLHQTVLEAIGVDEVLTPEIFAAEQIAMDVEYSKLIGSYIVNEDYRIIETLVPDIMTDQTVESIELEKNFNLKLVTIKRPLKKITDSFIKDKQYDIIENIPNDFILKTGDIFLMFGKMNDFQRFWKLY